MSSRADSSPFVVHDSLKPRSPRSALRQEACQISPSSAPSSPTWHTHRLVAGYGHPTQPQSAGVDKSSVDDATLSDSMRDQDDGDPHDLSFPSRHFPRASMVDNLVMSLDQFSPSNNGLRNHTPRAGPGRPREHTKSSSVTVESEIRSQTLREIPIVEITTARDRTGVQQVEHTPPDIFGEEEESQRQKAYNSQRAMQTAKTVSSRGNTVVKSRSDSTSSSIDLGHLAIYATRLGAAGNRRSQSFDYGSVKSKPLSDPVDRTITPVAYHGIENMSSPAPNEAADSPVVRRNSGRSAKGNYGKKARLGTNSAANARSRLESPQPQLSTKSQTFDTADIKVTSAILTDQSHTPRAGFFRRVFGSSNKSSIGPSSYPSPTRRSQDRSGSTLEFRRPPTPPGKLQRQAAVDPSHNKENQPMITKKPSSFFRRRKKSVSGGVPPPLPLTLNNNLDTSKPEPGASSPVSSLRAFMDPYLGDGAPRHVRGRSLQSVQPVDGGPLLNPPAPGKDSTNTTLAVTKSTRVDENGQGSRSTSPAKADVEQSLDTSTTTPDQSRPRPVMSLSEQSKQDDSPSKLRQSRPQPMQDLHSSLKMIKLVPQSSGSDISDYKSAPSTPMVTEMPDRRPSKSPAVHVSHPSISQTAACDDDDVEQARRIYDNTDEQVTPTNASAWLGEASSEREPVRIAYMSLFDWTNLTILAAIRNLCSKLVLKGETQQVDRILDAFAKRWCDCNINHGFKSADIVHTICYSILLLNTDLHLADIGKKMTRAEFIRNALNTIRENMPEQDSKLKDATNLLAVRSNGYTSPGPSFRPSVDRSASSLSTARPMEYLSREESYDENNMDLSGPLVEAPFLGSQSGWELQIESVLKDLYLSISREPLPLFGSRLAAKSTPQQSVNNLTTLSALRRTPSTLSKATSENRGRYVGDSRSLGARWASKTRSRPRLGTAQAFGSSRTSIDDQSSGWSPSMSSTWSRVSLGKTLTSMSVDSFGTDHAGGGYQSSIGFANALSQAITRDEQVDGLSDDGIKAVPLLEDESLELYGAPWAKEGILKHKCHLEGLDKRSKDRNWNDCFAVIEKGWMRLFSFSMTAKSLRNKARNHRAGAVVGGGNWQDNAEETWQFMLRHTIASSLPPPGYSKQRPYVWALSLPNGAVHLFSVGTPDIVKEFVSTANFWSARLSKEPMTGGVSSMEYGWSDSVINRKLIHSDSHSGFTAGSPRPSTQMSMRSSVDHGSIRPRLAGDKVQISEWVPPQQSLMASRLLEIDQMKALQTYVKTIENDFQRHNELRGPMLLAFSARHPNSQKAMTNWEKKSSYLLREIVKFRTYMDALQSAQVTKDKVDKMKREEDFGQQVGLEGRKVSAEVE